MCGILGYRPLPNQELEDRIECLDAFRRLFDQSRIRGLHAYGFASPLNGIVTAYRSFDSTKIPLYFEGDRLTIAHARYCTSGDWSILENNQPLVVDNMALAFNGVLHMGTKAEFEVAFDVQCQSDNDGEIFLRKIVGSETAEEAARKAEDFVGTIQGSFAGAFLAHGRLIVSRNSRRPLWKCTMYGAKWYASTEDIFRRAGFTGMEPVPVGTEIA